MKYIKKYLRTIRENGWKRHMKSIPGNDIIKKLREKCMGKLNTSKSLGFGKIERTKHAVYIYIYAINV